MLLLNVCVQAGPSVSPLKQLFGSRVSTLSEAPGDVGHASSAPGDEGGSGPGWCLYRELLGTPEGQGFLRDLPEGGFPSSAGLSVSSLAEGVHLHSL